MPDLTRFDGVTLIESSPTLLSRFDGTKSLERNQVTDLPLSGSFKAGDVIVAGNPGCLLQIRTATRDQGHDIPVRHLIEILDASITGRAVL